MPIGDPLEGCFYPTLTHMIDSYKPNCKELKIDIKHHVFPENKTDGHAAPTLVLLTPDLSFF